MVVTEEQFDAYVAARPELVIVGNANSEPCCADYLDGTGAIVGRVTPVVGDDYKPTGGFIYALRDGEI